MKREIIRYLMNCDFKYDKTQFNEFKNENCTITIGESGGITVDIKNSIDSTILHNETSDIYWLRGVLEYHDLLKNKLSNHNLVGKYLIMDNLDNRDFMKGLDGNIKIYDSLREASVTCGMYEFPDALVMQVIYNHVE